VIRYWQSGDYLVDKLKHGWKTGTVLWCRIPIDQPVPVNHYADASGKGLMSESGK